MLQLSDLKRVLVLAPHPDDETLGCGGAIALMAQAGCEVHVVFITNGDKIYPDDADRSKDIASVRRQEGRAACNVLGVREVHFLDFPDGSLQDCKDDLRRKVEDTIETIGPEIIFSPSPLDYHPDHLAVSHVAVKLLERKEVRVAFYEVYSTVRFNELIDISSVSAEKEKAIMFYTHSLYGRPEMYCKTMKGLNRFRTLFTLRDSLYEALWVVSGPVDARSVITWLTYGSSEVVISEDMASRDRKIMELSSRLDLMSDSMAWRAAGRFYRLRDLVLPHGSIRRSLYDRIARKVKKR